MCALPGLRTRAGPADRTSKPKGVTKAVPAVQLFLVPPGSRGSASRCARLVGVPIVRSRGGMLIRWAPLPCPLNNMECPPCYLTFWLCVTQRSSSSYLNGPRLRTRMPTSEFAYGTLLNARRTHIQGACTVPPSILVSFIQKRDAQ
jgi:hypothetical protein